MKVVYQLELQHPEIYNFKYYDLKRLRVARRLNTGILIDSSSNTGAVYLKEEEEGEEEEEDEEEGKDEEEEKGEDRSSIPGLNGKWIFTTTY